MLGLSHLPDTDTRWGCFHDVADKSRSKALLKTLRGVVEFAHQSPHQCAVLGWRTRADMLGRWSASENTFKHIKQPRAFDQTLQTICQNKTQLESGRN